MKKIIGLIAFCSFIIGCDLHNSDQGWLIKYGEYFQDPRTNLCFLEVGNRRIFTNVPCTQEVMQEIKNNSFNQ